MQLGVLLFCMEDHKTKNMKYCRTHCTPELGPGGSILMA